MQVAGEIKIGEATRWAGKAAARLNGHPWPVIISNAVSGGVMVIVMLGHGILQNLLDWPAWAWIPAIVIGLYVSLRLGVMACRAWCVRHARKAFGVRGLVDPVPTAFRIEDDAFVSLSGQVEVRAPWTAVSDVFIAGPYWVILAQSHPIYLPRRFFATPAEEKAFLSSILSRMGADAVARSAEASALTA